MATGTIKAPASDKVTLYNHTGSYKNDINVALTVGDLSRYSFIVLECYAGAMSSSSRAKIVAPVSGDAISASYYLFIYSATTTPSWMRMEASSGKVTILSSSLASIYVRSVMGIT